MFVADVDDIGRCIREERKRQGLTQGELADLCGVGITFVSQLENGKRSAEVGKVLDILKMLGIDVSLDRRASC